MKKGLFAVLAAMFFLSCEKELFPEFSTFYDTRDGITYEVVSIGTQTWMAENLKYLPEFGNYSNDLPSYAIPYFNSKNIEKAKENLNYELYGVLYNYAAAICACPEGWRLPGNEDWKDLLDHIGRSNNPEALKSEDMWLYGGTNESGFNLRPSPNLRTVSVWSTDYAFWGIFTNRLTTKNKDRGKFRQDSAGQGEWPHFYWPHAFIRCLKVE